jgi:hypothetical protein
MWALEKNIKDLEEVNRKIEVLRKERKKISNRVIQLRHYYKRKYNITK